MLQYKGLDIIKGYLENKSIIPELFDLIISFSLKDASRLISQPKLIISDIRKNQLNK